MKLQDLRASAFALAARLPFCGSGQRGWGLVAGRGGQALCRAPSSRCCSSTVRATRRRCRCCPKFEQKTGIKVNITTVPYENALGEQVRDFVAGGDLDIALIDLVWIGNFAENGWIEPIDKFTDESRARRSGARHRRLLPAGAERLRRLERHGLRPAVRQLFGPAVLQQLHARRTPASTSRRRPGRS